MTKKTKIILISAIVLFVIGMAVYPTIKKQFFSQKTEPEKSAASGQKESNRNRPLNVNVQIIKYENLNDIYRTTGTMIPDEEVNLSFETSGKITNIYFKEGSTVKKGALLAKVNDSPLQAELNKLNAQIPLAKDRVFRQKSLLEKDAVSLEAYEQVTTELEKLNADIESVKARIAQTELRAPFDGVIGLRQVSEGTYASPGTMIAKETKIIPLKLEFSINEKQAGQVAQGTNLSFKVEGDLNTYQASIYAVESTLDLKTRTLKTRAIYPNRDGKLKPGRTASVEIKLQELKNALTVPSQAIVAEMGRDIAYLYKGGKARQIILTKGMRTESKVQVLQGIQPGDTLITTGVMQLRDGMSVIIDHVIN
jgi:membrane fusion protein (multidrug efflux system)